jgi:hypothetical protein
MIPDLQAEVPHVALRRVERRAVQPLALRRHAQQRRAGQERVRRVHLRSSLASH